MTGENQENSPGEKEKSGRVAHCLNCTNEWTPRDQADKKRKCPVCGKYRVVWKDELPENKPDSSTSPGEKKEKSGENEEKNEEEKLQEAMKSVGGISPFMAIGAIVALGLLAILIWFLSRRGPRKTHQQAPPEPPINNRVQNALRRL